MYINVAIPDDACHLLPSHATFIPNRVLIDKVVACLSTRFDALPAPVCASLPETFDQWARFRILPAGDTIRAAEMETQAEDGRDAMFVRVRFSLCFVHASCQPILMLLDLCCTSTSSLSTRMPDIVIVQSSWSRRLFGGSSAKSSL